MATLRPMPLLMLVRSGQPDQLDRPKPTEPTSCLPAPRVLAEDAGFEPARAVNPTRVPGERHRPLGESSVAMVAANPARSAPLPAKPPPTGPTPTGPTQVLHSRWTPRGVYPVNSPRAGRQQGS